MRLEPNKLKVETFPTTPDGDAPQSFTGSTDYCCDTRWDCSEACDHATNVCRLCG